MRLLTSVLRLAAVGSAGIAITRHLFWLCACTSRPRLCPGDEVVRPQTVEGLSPFPVTGEHLLSHAGGTAYPVDLPVPTVFCMAAQEACLTLYTALRKWLQVAARQSLCCKCASLLPLRTTHERCLANLIASRQTDTISGLASLAPQPPGYP